MRLFKRNKPGKNAAVMLAMAVVLLLNACTTNTTGPEPTPNGPMIPVTGIEDFDKQYLLMMIPHHEATIEMANAALKRTQAPVMVAMANDTISEHEAEIRQMREWLAAWYNIDETPDLNAMPVLPGVTVMGVTGEQGTTMDMKAEMKRLRSYIDTFEPMFLDAMIDQHRSALDAAAIAVQLAEHPELKALAGEILVSQQEELARMQELQVNWAQRSMLGF